MKDEKQKVVEKEVSIQVLSDVVISREMPFKIVLGAKEEDEQ